MESQGLGVDVSMSHVTPEMTGVEHAAEDLEIRRSRSAILPEGPPDIEHSRSAMWFLRDDDPHLEPCERSRTALVCLKSCAEGAIDGEAASSGHFREEIVMASGGAPQRKKRPSRTAIWFEDDVSMPDQEQS
mmetsp:Transcript_10709/g.23571  ORF Transcript_10709/g.23571 Transcript_10709/m.23571 type:complete len:132 (+) Transcript_10709:51-446(+)